MPSVRGSAQSCQVVNIMNVIFSLKPGNFNLSDFHDFQTVFMYREILSLSGLLCDCVCVTYSDTNGGCLI